MQQEAKEFTTTLIDKIQKDNKDYFAHIKEMKKGIDENEK